MLSMKLILAPMATLSHQALRKTIALFGGCDEYYTEMINASSLIANGQFEKYYLLNAPDASKLVYQLTGKESDSLVNATKILTQLDCLGIDINMGCSAPEIVKTQAGIAWMLKPLTETAQMLSGVKKAITNSTSTTEKRLSVKCRMGDENFTKEGFFAFIDMLIQEGVTQIVLHPRTRRESLSRLPRLEFIQELAEYVKEKYQHKIQIIGNGCIDSIQKEKDFIKRVPLADGIMIGRCAVQKPWIFSVLKESENPVKTEKTKIDLLQVAEYFIEQLVQSQPSEFIKTRTQRFYTYFCDNFQFGHYLKNSIINLPVDENLIQNQFEKLKEYFEKMPEEQFVSF